jgi:hypothetical protein
MHALSSVSRWTFAIHQVTLIEQALYFGMKDGEKVG